MYRSRLKTAKKTLLAGYLAIALVFMHGLRLHVHIYDHDQTASDHAHQVQAHVAYAAAETAHPDEVAEIDSDYKGDRLDLIRRFSPYYNGSSSAALAEEYKKEIRVLISTDVLAEGLNLQDATRVINYELHWNPVRLIQRFGRIDRIGGGHPPQTKIISYDRAHLLKIP